jgi:hypothetical protein
MKSFALTHTRQDRHFSCNHVPSTFCIAISEIEQRYATELLHANNAARLLKTFRANRMAERKSAHTIKFFDRHFKLLSCVADQNCVYFLASGTMRFEYSKAFQWWFEEVKCGMARVVNI